MTLMCPKPRRLKYKKQTKICQKCQTEYTPDGRGRSIYCSTCAQANYEHYKKVYLQKERWKKQHTIRKSSY